MKKLLEILTESTKFYTTQLGSDQETGTTSWKVEYTPLVSLNKNLDKVYEDFKKVATKHPEDLKLQEYLETFALLKKGLRFHVTRKYGKNK